MLTKSMCHLEFGGYRVDKFVVQVGSLCSEFCRVSELIRPATRKRHLLTAVSPLHHLQSNQVQSNYSHHGRLSCLIKSPGVLCKRIAHTDTLPQHRPEEMSHCHDEHEGHGHGHDHHEHDHSDDITPAVQFSLYSQINFDRVITLNEAQRDVGQAVVKKTWQERLSVEPELASDVDEQLLMTVPYVFSGRYF